MEHSPLLSTTRATTRLHQDRLYNYFLFSRLQISPILEGEIYALYLKPTF